MQITETASEGLKREYRVVVPAADIDRRIADRLGELGRQAKVPGFRPGKIPLSILRQRYGGSVMSEVLEQMVGDSSGKVIAEKGLRPALQPKIEIQSFAEGQALDYTMALEVLPEVEPPALEEIALERPVAVPDEEAIKAALTRLAEANRQTEPVEGDRGAEDGDIAVIDFEGMVDGERRPGMKGEGHALELGSGRFIPGFEEQLGGMKPGETRTITVTFPEDYAAAELSGKAAEFEVTLKELRRKLDATVDDALATRLGQEDLAKLETAVREEIEREYAALSRLRTKRALLDWMADRATFAVPSGMVDLEFDAIWRRLEQERAAGQLDEADAAKDEETLKGEYRAIAERRVRLGLLLNEIGRRNQLQVTQEELNRALIEEAQMHRGRERDVIEFYRNNPRALDNLRAPVYEDKVVDFVLSKANITDRVTTPDELAREAEAADA